MLSAHISNQTRKAVYRRDGYRCALCDDTRGLQVHHVVRRSFGSAFPASTPTRYAVLDHLMSICLSFPSNSRSCCTRVTLSMSRILGQLHCQSTIYSAPMPRCCTKSRKNRKSAVCGTYAHLRRPPGPPEFPARKGIPHLAPLLGFFRNYLPSRRERNPFL